MFSAFSSALKFVLPPCDKKWLTFQKRSRNNDGLEKIVRARQREWQSERAQLLSPYSRQRQHNAEATGKKKKDLYVVPCSMGKAGAAEQWAEENIWEITNQNISDSEIQDDKQKKRKKTRLRRITDSNWQHETNMENNKIQEETGRINNNNQGGQEQRNVASRPGGGSCNNEWINSGSAEPKWMVIM